MTCDELAAQLTDFFEGTLSADVEAAALDHLATCPRCERVIGETRAIIGLGRSHGRARLEADERAALLDRIMGDVSSGRPAAET